MANPEHLKILKQGVEAFNKWQRENPTIKPDLIAADLNGADLRGAMLLQANLKETKFFASNLNRAILFGADLYQADLKDADLRVTDLRWANLTRADLSGANLTHAVAGYTMLADVDLSRVQGIETIDHDGPSSIGIDTIFRSQGKIPEIFLRRAGVPEVFISNMRSLVTAMAPIDFYSCFISYSSKDQDFADRLYADLQAKGVRCWLATEDLKIGDPFRQRIDDAIRLHDKLLVVLSETSVASSWVESEVESALEKERKGQGEVVLFPIRLDEAVMETKQAWAADIRRKRHMGDFRNWQDHNTYLKAFERLLRDLKGATGSVPA